MMRRFNLVRDEDESGVSGTGLVACGVEFDRGQCVMKWNGEVSSTAIYPSIEALEYIHGHGGKTRIEWVDD